MIKINLILLVKRFYILAVGKIICTLQVIFIEDPFFKVYVPSERNLLNVGWRNEWWPRKVWRHWMHYKIIIEFSYFEINLLGYFKWTVLQPQYKLQICRENRIPNEWRNSVITLISKKYDRREPKNYRRVSILNTCYEMYSKILNMKPQKWSELFMTETRNGFRKGRSCTDPTFCFKLLIEKKGI